MFVAGSPEPYDDNGNSPTLLNNNPLFILGTDSINNCVMKIRKLYKKPQMKAFEVKSISKLLAGSEMSLGASQNGYGDEINEYNETDGGWEE